ncbi:BTAD domain-containing putative transcriptional regulator [Streptomyces sp. NPDC048324]|uniref:AfsR/SARP family transcriptional regulator n=1 Tax=Streptomyces sp. NPDC048324 TaxID=3157205 RepID=UPI0034400A95
MDGTEPARFEVLGPLRVLLGTAEPDLGFPQQRALLALLLVRAGRPVPADEIVDVLWPGRPPASALNTVRRYMGSLRRLLEPGLPPRAAGRRIVRGADGCLLAADDDEVDLLRFRGLTRRAKRAAATGRPEVALRHFLGALAEWRGPVAAGIPPAVRQHAVFTEVERELVRTTVMAADAALLCGRTREVLPQLRRALGLDPLSESLHARLVLSLAAAGRQAEALAAHESVRLTLARELGVAPGAELSAAHTRVLRQDVRPAEAAPRHDTSRGTLVRPSQLPPELPRFTGRHAELRGLRALVGGDGAPTAVLLTGTAGVGKTALAVHWAHEVAERYPDGRLHVDLRGFDPRAEPLPPAEALRSMLGALGVSGRRLPGGLDGLAGLYRSTLSGRRTLVLLDDAFDTEQVRPLLPASPGCLTLVTSRRGLSGLVTAGARPLRVDLPSAADALELLAAHVGRDRLAAEPAAADEIVGHCGRLPLALTAVAARLAGRPDLPLAAFAGELHRSRGSFDALAGVRAAFAASGRHLSADATQMLRLLARHPDAELTAEAAGDLAGLPVRRARALLDELADVHLVSETAPGRFAGHPLLQPFAVEAAGAADA